MEWRIPLAELDIGREEQAAVREVLEGRWLTMGAVAHAFEQEFAAYVGARHAIAVTNGTAALHLASLVIGLGPGDEVIVPAFTFVATAAAIRYTGATPVFTDIESENDLNLSPVSIEDRLTDRTRAIMVMHYGGYPCDMLRIMTLAERHGLRVIEDAAHAPGTELQDRKLGTWGDVGCYSFFSNKNMATGEGGMLVTDDDEIAHQLRLLRSHGMTTLTWDRHRGHASSYDVVTLGYNYRIDEIRAAIGRVQLKKLDRNNALRREYTLLYHELLQEWVPEISLPFSNHQGTSACHLFPILLPEGLNRTRFMEIMKAHGIQTSVHYPPIHRFQAYKHDYGDGSLATLPVTEAVADREVTLPLYATLGRKNVALVAQAVRDALGEMQHDKI